LGIREYSSQHIFLKLTNDGIIGYFNRNGTAGTLQVPSKQHAESWLGSILAAVSLHSGVCARS